MPQSSPIRIEGRVKVTGAALYTGDFGLHTLTPYLQPREIASPILHALAVQSTIPAGHILSIDTTKAAAIPGVRNILTHLNAPRLHKVRSLMSSEVAKFLPLQNEIVHYHGQPIVLIVAETLDAVRQAASLVEIKYAPEPALLDFEANLPYAKDEKKIGAGDPGQIERGNPEAAFLDAPIRIDHTYATDAAHHNPIEPAATLAHWHAPSEEPIRLTVISSTQFAYGDALILGGAFQLGAKDSLLRIGAQVLTGLELESKVRVIAPVVGGGFGSKGGNSHLVLAAMAAKVAGQPVKLILERPQTFNMMPYRSATRQTVRLGADTSGRISVLHQHSIVQNAETSSFVEPMAEATPHLYDIPHISIRHKSVRLHVNTPGWMRAPGIAPGQFALESALDELATELRMDPIELRLLNYAEHDPETGHEWSSKSLRECYKAGAHSIGWRDRPQQPATLREGDHLIGYGMATAAYPTNQFPATARLTLYSDGTVLAQTSAQEIGQGAITALSQLAAEAFSIPLQNVRLQIGDTTLPMAFMAGGSSTTLSVGSAIEAAAQKLRRRIFSFAISDRQSPLHGARRDDLLFRDASIVDRNNASRAQSLVELLRRNHREPLIAKGIAGRTFGKSPYGRFAFGAQFARVAVYAPTGHIQVTHMSGAFAAGRILNPRTARSQFLGGMIWGLGQALMERTTLDLRHGAWVNTNLGEALVPTNADVPAIDVITIDEDDTRGNALGIKGVGEIGITGVAAAIANAVYNATGRRTRSLPITLDKLL
jgi:xanthine dehydrogenase YagR molybdenum-binding subunit